MLSHASCDCSQISLDSGPSLEAARMAVLGPSYSSGALRPSSANMGEPAGILSRPSPPVKFSRYASQPFRLRYQLLLGCLGLLLYPAMQPAPTGALPRSKLWRPADLPKCLVIAKHRCLDIGHQCRHQAPLSGVQERTQVAVLRGRPWRSPGLRVQSSLAV
jgi:hypothetical protein